MLKSVGQAGANLSVDVMEVQTALNRFAAKMAIRPLKQDGRCGPMTVDAIRRLQGAMGMSQPTGLIAPGGETAEGLGLSGAAPITASANDVSLSGATWWRANQSKWPNERNIDSLADPFRTNVKMFTAALAKAGAQVAVGATMHSMPRAKLMRFSWDVSKGIISPKNVPEIDGVVINWDHSIETKSRSCATEMVNLFNIVKQPSLTSNHVKGVAIDMTIRWKGDLMIADSSNSVVKITTSPRNGENTKIHDLGATYGVLHKLPDDPPHWSVTGH
jgi:hypothetical protein